jgi:Zn-dependent peptidase ImmA (M78 family)
MRDEESEREANIFAICLLMPKQMVDDWVKAYGPFDMCDDDGLKRCAKDFGVPLTVASLRLADLGYFKI